jgi:hypothetical protein
MPLNEMTIFYIAVFVFFICPVVLVLCAVVSDQMTKANPPAPERDRWSGPIVRTVVRSSGPDQ